jgi:hypothetical protein
MVHLVKRGRHGARWDEEADAELRRRFAAGELLPDVARAMNRSQEAVRTRANVLQVPVRSTIRAARTAAPVAAQTVVTQAAAAPEAEAGLASSAGSAAMPPSPAPLPSRPA